MLLFSWQLISFRTGLFFNITYISMYCRCSQSHTGFTVPHTADGNDTVTLTLKCSHSKYIWRKDYFEVYSRKEIILVVSINMSQFYKLKKKSEKCILKKHSIDFNIVKKKRKISNVYREHMYIQMSEEFQDNLLLFSVDFYSMVYILRGLNIGCFNTIVKLYFYFVLN